MPVIEELIKWWNVVVKTKDNSYKVSYSRGLNLAGAKRWWNNSLALSNRADFKEVVEFNENYSSTYEEFCAKEKELKKKYNII